MGVMMLAAGMGTEVEAGNQRRARAKAMDALLALIADKFGEGVTPPRPASAAGRAAHRRPLNDFFHPWLGRCPGHCHWPRCAGGVQPGGCGALLHPARAGGGRDRARAPGRNTVVDELQRLQADMPADAPHELGALLDVHLMLLQDEALEEGVKHWITERLYNAEWALTTQLEVIARQFDEMEDEYLRERKADLEQVVERILRYMKGVASPVAPPVSQRRKTQQDLLLDDTVDVPWCWWRTTCRPPTCCSSKQSVFAGFVTDVGGKTSHTAIVARSMDIPAVVGARAASQLVRQDDWSSSTAMPA